MYNNPNVKITPYKYSTVSTIQLHQKLITVGQF